MDRSRASHRGGNELLVEVSGAAQSEPAPQSGEEPAAARPVWPPLTLVAR